MDISGLTTGGPSSSCEIIILRNKSHGEIIRVCIGIFTTTLRNCGGAVASWLVRPTPSRVVRVRGRGHCVVFLGKTQRFSSPRCTNGYQQMCWGNPAMDKHPIQGGSSNTPRRFMLRKPELRTDPMGPYKGFTTLKNKKNTVKFSIKIPHLTCTAHHLLSDRLQR